MPNKPNDIATIVGSVIAIACFLDVTIAMISSMVLSCAVASRDMTLAMNLVDIVFYSNLFIIVFVVVVAIFSGLVNKALNPKKDEIDPRRTIYIESTVRRTGCFGCCIFAFPIGLGALIYSIYSIATINNWW